MQVFPNPYDVVPQSDVEVSLVSVSPILLHVRFLWLVHLLQLPVFILSVVVIVYVYANALHTHLRMKLPDLRLEF